MSKETIINKLNRIKEEIMNEEGISYSEIHFLQCNKEIIMELQDIVLAQWAGITEAEWHRGELYNENIMLAGKLLLVDVQMMKN